MLTTMMAGRAVAATTAAEGRKGSGVRRGLRQRESSGVQRGLRGRKAAPREGGSGGPAVGSGGGGDAGEGREMEEMAGGVGLQAADGGGGGNRQRHECTAAAGSRGGAAVRRCRRSGRQQRALRHRCAPARKLLRAGRRRWVRLMLLPVEKTAAQRLADEVAEEEGSG
ncbi:hypothetical protein BHE74_00021118 [Ensete ventricosum]|nr:hypothetical protein GW17_00040891 [Ensete ventricosum]RWW71159.1 hypothetical protein BHE74_00021118 [Ensete ventricosum]RZS08077.1 hypothetical protein BHM03_00039002 [Ensete ventricosum]